jgi:hypothetical protein
MIMKKYSFLSLLFFSLVMLNGCEKDYLTQKKVEINFPVSFAENIVPIMVEDCAIPTCHIAGAQAPNLTASKAYDELTGLGYVDTTNAEGSLLYQRIIATIKPMPPTTKLTPEEIGFILAWIKQGAQNN